MSTAILALLLVADTDAASPRHRHQSVLGVNRTQAKTMSAMYAFYHITFEISSVLSALTAKCPNMKLEHITKTVGIRRSTCAAQSYFIRYQNFLSGNSVPEWCHGRVPQASGSLASAYPPCTKLNLVRCEYKPLRY